MSDRIVYVVTSKPGGVDGRDHTAKGGPRIAFTSKAEAEKKKTAWDDVVPTIITAEEAPQIVRNARAKLTPVELLLLCESFKQPTPP